MLRCWGHRLFSVWPYLESTRHTHSTLGISACCPSTYQCSYAVIDLAVTMKLFNKSKIRYNVRNAMLHNKVTHDSFLFNAAVWIDYFERNVSNLLFIRLVRCFRSFISFFMWNNEKNVSVLLRSDILYYADELQTMEIMRLLGTHRVRKHVFSVIKVNNREHRRRRKRKMMLNKTNVPPSKKWKWPWRTG